MMPKSPVGEVRQIYRYPVKSFSGEGLNCARIEVYGLYGDRCYAFVDNTKQGWDRFVTARHIPQMLGYRAILSAQADVGEFAQVEARGPDGRKFQWDDDLLQEIQQYTSRKISAESHRASSRGKKAVDDGSILIISESSIRTLEQLWGKKVDPSRFRPNLLISLNDEASGHEAGWIGKGIRIGDVELSIQSLCERCSMITFDPDTIERDPSLLTKVYEGMALQFGIYADVEKTGMIQIGDPIYYQV
jgi:uncharacterized protein YcbX